MASAHPRTIRDLYGLPPPSAKCSIPRWAPPEEAAKLGENPEIVTDKEWGLDHGSWSVLRHIYPNADVPAFQLSLDERRSFKEHLELGREIQSLRERGVLILGSGNIVHHLRRIDWNNSYGAYDWAVEFDTRVKNAVDARDANGLTEPQEWGDALPATAHPSVEHHPPLLYGMGRTNLWLFTCEQAAQRRPSMR